jgi:phage-related protein
VKRTIRFYKTSSGRCPVEEYLNSLSGKAAQKVTWVLQFIEELDAMPEQYLKKLTSDIWKCRIQFGGNTYRVLCFFDGSIIVLTHGFRKKIRKTPRPEIEKADIYSTYCLQRREK